MVSHSKVQGPPTAFPDIPFHALFLHIKKIFSGSPPAYIPGIICHGKVWLHEAEASA